MRERVREREAEREGERKRGEREGEGEREREERERERERESENCRDAKAYGHRGKTRVEKRTTGEGGNSLREIERQTENKIEG